MSRIGVFRIYVICKGTLKNDTMSSTSTSVISSFIDAVSFYVGRFALRCRARRYRRLAIHDEIRIGDDLVITHQRRDLKFESKVAEFNREYKVRAPKGAVSVSVGLRKSNYKDKQLRTSPSFLTFYFFRFRDTLTVQKGDRKVVLDRTRGLGVYGDLKAVFQEGGKDDFYRQTVLVLAATKDDVKPAKQTSSVPEEPDAIVLDPEAVAREHERFVGNVDKIGKAINNGACDGPVEFEDHEKALVEYLRGCEDCKATKQNLQAQLTPYRRRLGTVVESINRKSCDVTGEPLIVQDDGDGDYQMIVSYYNIIFSDGR